MKLALVVCAIVALAAAEIKLEHELKDPSNPKNLEQVETLKKFIKLVDEKHLNVTVIISTAEKHSNGQLKNAVSLAVNFPANNAKLTKSTLTVEDAKEIVKLATKDKLPAQGLFTTESGVTGVTNSHEAIPVTGAHEIVTGIPKEDEDIIGFAQRNDFASQMTFISPGEDGKNVTTKILWGNIKVTLLKDHNLKDQLPVIQQTVKNALFMYEDVDIPRVISATLDQKLPGGEWQVAEVESEEQYVKASKWALVEAQQTKYLIFSNN